MRQANGHRLEALPVPGQQRDPRPGLVEGGSDARSDAPGGTGHQSVTALEAEAVHARGLSREERFAVTLRECDLGNRSPGEPCGQGSVRITDGERGAGDEFRRYPE